MLLSMTELLSDIFSKLICGNSLNHYKDYLLIFPQQIKKSTCDL